MFICINLSPIFLRSILKSASKILIEFLNFHLMKRKMALLDLNLIMRSYS